MVFEQNWTRLKKTAFRPPYYNVCPFVPTAMWLHCGHLSLPPFAAPYAPVYTDQNQCTCYFNVSHKKSHISIKLPHKLTYLTKLCHLHICFDTNLFLPSLYSSQSSFIDIYLLFSSNDIYAVPSKVECWCFRPYTCLLGRVPHTDIYNDISVYEAVSILTTMNFTMSQCVITTTGQENWPFQTFLFLPPKFWTHTFYVNKIKQIKLCIL